MNPAQSLPDVSVWFALNLTGHVHHEAARTWFQGSATDHRVCFCRVSQSGLLRLLTTDAVMRGYGRAPLSNVAAMDQYHAWLALGNVDWSNEPAGLDEVWAAYAGRPTASPKLWMDAYLAAFARNTGSQLVTCDKAMRQFHGVKVLVLG
ncbi:MAG TPA: PIN domain-containing protein [Flavobacteriales bacterium]|nr:PIN domain-containing protein [Flavobacteriales bacterium]